MNAVPTPDTNSSLIRVARFALAELIGQTDWYDDELPESLAKTIIELYEELVAQGEDMGDYDVDIEGIRSEMEEAKRYRV